MIGWLKQMFQSKRHLRESRKYLHENRNEMQRSIAISRQTGKKSIEALKVAEQALKLLQRNERQHNEN